MYNRNTPVVFFGTVMPILIAVANSSQVQVGQSDIAMGSPPGLEQAATTGIVSALNREGREQVDGNTYTLTGMIQTSAPFNPANSDGALVHRPRTVDRHPDPVYGRAEAERLAKERGWVVKPDGDKWRRVVPSPAPKRILDTKVVDLLLNNGIVVVCAGGGGVPIVRRQDEIIGVEAVIDKDRASALLATELRADVFAMLTDVDAVYVDYGKPSQRALGAISPDELESYTFPAGSMGPKVESACAFARASGHTAIIGSLVHITELAQGRAGTRVSVHQSAAAV